MSYNTQNAIMGIKEIDIQGNVIDNGWIEHLKYENGKPHLNAVMILSEIVYWYKPTEVRDEATGSVLGYKKKFKADMLQKSYDDLGERFGLSDRQAKAAIDFLISKKLIYREFRTIVINGTAYSNVMFIAPVVEELKKITGINRYLEDDSNTLLQSNVGGVLHSNVTPSYNQMYHPPTTERNTYTKTTTKTTNKDYFSSCSRNVEELINLFEANITELKPTTKCKFIGWCKSIDNELIKTIILYGAETNAKSYSWFEATVVKSKEKNIKTSEAFTEDIEKYRANRKSKYNKNPKKDSVPIKPPAINADDDKKTLKEKLLGWD